MIKLGEHNGKTVGFDLDVLLATRLLIQASSGAGKSWAIRRIVEQAFSHDGARRMLQALVDAKGRPMNHDFLAQSVGMTRSGTYSTYLSDLRRARLIETSGGSVSANKETLFL